MVKKISLGVLLLIVLFLGYVAIQPEDYTISRKIIIKAPAEKIFLYLNNSKLAEQWGPWLEVDPQAKMQYSGPDQGIGSRASWSSSGRLGTGSATIVGSTPNQRVQIKLEYTRPMSMSQVSEYVVQPLGDQNLVTWKVQGKNTFLGRLMCCFGDMDKMVGGMFEKGLRNLKTLVERETKH